MSTNKIIVLAVLCVIFIILVTLDGRRKLKKIRTEKERTEILKKDISDEE